MTPIFITILQFSWKPPHKFPIITSLAEVCISHDTSNTNITRNKCTNISDFKLYRHQRKYISCYTVWRKKVTFKINVLIFSDSVQTTYIIYRTKTTTCNLLMVLHFCFKMKVFYLLHTRFRSKKFLSFRFHAPVNVRVLQIDTLHPAHGVHQVLLHTT